MFQSVASRPMATFNPVNAAPTAAPMQSPSVTSQFLPARERAIAELVPSALAYKIATETARAADLDDKALRCGVKQLPDGRLFWAPKTLLVPNRLPLDYVHTRTDEGATNFKRALLDELRKLKEQQYQLCEQDSTDWEKTPREKHHDVIVFHTQFVVDTGAIESLILDGRRSSFPYNFQVLTDGDKELFADFFNMRSLRILNCGLTSCENIPRFKFLKELDLTGNKITNFKGLLCFRYLKTLKLEGNQITTLKHFPFSPGLEELDLSLNPFNDSLARLLERAAHLKVLKLTFTKISAADHLLPLSKMTHLEVIDIRGTPLLRYSGRFAMLGALRSKLVY
ncbi:UNVERIFIED_CONTAM: leucine rich repeat-containing protein [Hammondia hammondi]|eukprot:XP_008885983.1 leucine rich repeat-containing protein [Hammondia hammondi]